MLILCLYGLYKNLQQFFWTWVWSCWRVLLCPEKKNPFQNIFSSERKMTTQTNHKGNLEGVHWDQDRSNISEDPVVHKTLLQVFAYCCFWDLPTDYYINSSSKTTHSSSNDIGISNTTIKAFLSRLVKAEHQVKTLRLNIRGKGNLSTTLVCCQRKRNPLCMQWTIVIQTQYL